METPLLDPELAPSIHLTSWFGSYKRQLGALLVKNMKVKSRKKWVTLAEILSPLLVMSLIVLGYGISSTVSLSTRPILFVKNIDIPVDYAVQGIACLTPPYNCSIDPKRALHDLISYSGPIPLLDLDMYVATSRLSSRLIGNNSILASQIKALTHFDARLQNLFNLGELVFVPDSPEVHQLVTSLNETYSHFQYVYGGIYNSTDDIVVPPRPTWAIVEFHELNVKHGKVNYTINMAKSSMPSFSSLFDPFEKRFSKQFLRYVFGGFLTIEASIGEYALKSYPLPPSGSPKLPHDIRDRASYTATPFPVPFVKGENPFFQKTGIIVGMLVALSMFFPFSMLLSCLVQEKESQSKDTMKIMGLSTGILTLSWCITYMFMFFATSVLSTIMLSLTALSSTNPLILFSFIFSYCMSLIPLAILFSTLFTQSTLAVMLGILILLTGVIPRYSLISASENEALVSKILVSLLSPSATVFAMDLIVQYESIQSGLQMSSLWIDFYSSGMIFIMIWVDMLLYLLIALYLQQVVPGPYGPKQPWYFLLTASFWIRSFRYEEHSVHPDTPMVKAVEEEPYSPLLCAGVSMEGLRREFDTAAGTKVAVRNLTLKMYEGQITALLGHNGAGKTTTLSMLTGMLPPTRGDCFINGLSIREDMHKIRGLLGVCPQRNVLYDYLTVQEHLYLYAILKDVPELQCKAAVNEILTEVGLLDKATEYSCSLSGGMKRKLCIGIAILGNSKVLVLDEPTTGMDPHSRRAIWSLLRKHRPEKVIILTTHFMDEADLLGDRIAIMANGRLKCVGSSMFLKTKFGIGYTLTLVKSSDDGLMTCELDADKFVTSRVEGAVPFSRAGSELSYQLPFTAKHLLGVLFRDLENSLERLGVRSYGVSVTSLEEVFLTVAQYDDDIDKVTSTSMQSEVPVSIRLSGDVQYDLKPPSYMEQVKTLYYKRIKCAMRDFKSKMFEIAVPLCMVAFIYIALGMSYASPETRLEYSTLLLRNMSRHHELLPETIIPYVHSSDSELAISSSLDSPHDDILIDTIHKQTSLALSKYLEKTYYSHPGTRFISFCPDDLIKVTSTKKTRMFLVQLIETGLLHKFAMDSIRDKVGDRLADQLSNDFELMSMLADLVPVGKEITVDLETLKPFIPSIVYTNNFTASLNFNDFNITIPVIGNTNASVTTLRDDLEEGVITLMNQLNFKVSVKNIGSVVWNNGKVKWAPRISMLHNSTSPHAAVIGAVSMVDASLKALSSGQDSEPYYSVSAKHLPTTPMERSRHTERVSILASFFLIIPFCYIPASFTGFIVNERVIKSQHLQFVSGAPVSSYWIATLLWDLTNLMGLSLVIVTILAISTLGFVGDFESAFLTLFILLCYGIAVLPLSYVCSFLFVNPSAAQVGVTAIHFVGGFLCVIASFTLDILKITTTVNAYLTPLYMLFPSYCLGHAFILLCFRSYVDPDVLALIPFPLMTTWWLSCILVMQSIIYTLLLLLLESAYLRQRLWSAFRWSLGKSGVHHGKVYFAMDEDLIDEEDEDVAKERLRVITGQCDEDTLVINQLRKVYNPKGSEPVIALRDLCLSIGFGECFGFLGVNGAGKSTTMNILTGDLTATAGGAIIDGYDIVSELNQVQSIIGYCPQFDPLLESLTGRETLLFYSKLRGVPHACSHSVVENLLQRVGLFSMADRACGMYSGGNKRKLSLAIALIGNPKVVFLDEPSSGMDPVSRRFMWDVIKSLRSRHSIVLTTHSMEECEALCTRVGIMDKGALKCLGSIQHLKNRFGVGYNLELKLLPGLPYIVEDVKEFMIDSFSTTCVLEEEHPSFLRYQISSASLSLSEIFDIIDGNSARFQVIDYVISQTSLDQIFISIVGKNSGKRGFKNQ